MATRDATGEAMHDEAEAASAFELRRRDAYRLVFGAAAAALLPPVAEAAGGPRFLHGVASGDPLRNRVIIWTRVTPVGTRSVPLTWKVATNPDMTGVVASGERNARRDRDFTAKVDVDGLMPGQTYYYQFAAPGGVLSPIGTTRTLPPADSTDPFGLLVFSCSNFEKGFFNAYAEAATESGIAAVLHLGDYIYEYGVGGYTTPAMAPPPTGLGITDPRAGQLNPTTEIVMLDAYYLRHSLYRSDPNLQGLHGKFPWIVAYDDHESANNAWTDGAENHQDPPEGPWQGRKEAALRAYYDWMPIREPVGRQIVDPVTGDPTGVFRSFRFGRVANLSMLDTRLAGRDEQFSPATLLAAYADPSLDQVGGRPRTLLGQAQETWLDSQLEGSRQTWQLIGNQTLCHYQNAADFLNFPLFDQATKDLIIAGLDALFPGIPGAGALFGQLGATGGANPAAADSWTGYPTARARLNASLAKAANPVILSGDSHNAWAANLRGNVGAGLVDLGVEFGGQSTSSPGLEQFFFTFPPAVLSALYTFSAARSPTDKLVFAETSRRGYMRVDVSREKVTTTYVFLSTVFSTSYTVDRSNRREVLAGARRITGT
jgi:alkaline phosphatase D